MNSWVKEGEVDYDVNTPAPASVQAAYKAKGDPAEGESISLDMAREQALEFGIGIQLGCQYLVDWTIAVLSDYEQDWSRA